MSDPNDHAWWKGELERGRWGILREARRAGLARAEAEPLARKLLDEAARELQAPGAEMTVAMLRRWLVLATRREIAEVLRGPRNPFHVSEAWRERYHATEPLVEDDTSSPEPVPDGVANSESAAESTPGNQGRRSEGFGEAWHVLGLLHLIGFILGRGAEAWWLAGLALVLLGALACWTFGQADMERRCAQKNPAECP